MQDISLNFNVAGDERKKLVKAVGAYKQVTPEYLGVPSFAFRIDEMIIDKDGILIIEGGMEPEKLQEFLKYLEEKGFHTTVAATEDTPTEDTPTEPAEQAEYEMEPEDTPTEEPTLLTIEVPRDGFTEESIINLQKIIDSRNTKMIGGAFFLDCFRRLSESGKGRSCKAVFFYCARFFMWGGKVMRVIYK